MKYIFISIVILSLLAQAALPTDSARPHAVAETIALLTSALSSAVVPAQASLMPPRPFCAPCPRPSCAPCVCTECPPCDACPPCAASRMSTVWIALVCGALVFVKVLVSDIVLLMLNIAAKNWDPDKKFRITLARYTEGLDTTLKKQREAELSQIKKERDKLAKEKEEMAVEIEKLREAMGL